MDHTSHNHGIWTVKHVWTKLLAVALLAMASFGFVKRFLPIAGNLVDLLMIGISIFTFMHICKADFRIRRDQLILSLILATLCLGFLTSLVLNQRATAVVQFILYASYLTPLFLAQKVSAEESYKIFLPILMVLGLIQLPADIFFPKIEEHLLDMYAGTFQIANNKSRFVFVTLICVVFIYRSKTPYVNKIVLPAVAAAMLVSFKLGDSIFVYLFGTIAVFLGVFHKRRYVAAGFAAIFVVCFYYVFNVYADEPVIMFTYNRFFDPGHGVMAIVDYGFQLVQETYFLGAGLGEFVSRASQSSGGLYLDAVPRTMVTFGTIYENTAAPTGLPAYISIIAEMGVLGIFFSALLVYYLYRSADKSYLGFVFFIYIILLSLFLPMFYEGPDGMLFVYSYVILNKALEHKRRMACVG